MCDGGFPRLLPATPQRVAESHRLVSAAVGDSCAASWLRFFWRSTSVLVQELRLVPCSVVVVAVVRLCGCVGSCVGDLG